MTIVLEFLVVIVLIVAAAALSAWVRRDGIAGSRHTRPYAAVPRRRA